MKSCFLIAICFYAICELIPDPRTIIILQAGNILRVLAVTVLSRYGMYQAENVSKHLIFTRRAMMLICQN